MNRRLRDESGYSLVEVMAAIMILAVAIIPMVGMFDTGLNVAAQGSNYDKARMLANRKLEEAKSLSYVQLKNNFPVASSTPGGDGSYTSDFLTVTGSDFTGFEYRVQKRYLVQPPVAPLSSSRSLNEPSSSDQGLMKVTVTVRWGGSNTYSTSGLVAQG